MILFELNCSKGHSFEIWFKDGGAADRQLAGLFLVNATAASGEQLVVKVYGRDAHDSALISTLWRTLWYREPGSPLRLGRLQQVEHEAFRDAVYHNIPEALAK